MGRLCLAALLAAAPLGQVAAHPGWGLVRDPIRKIVFYTDLTKVLMVDSLGRRSVAVPDVHTHELRIDSTGTLFGEDLEGLGGDRWRYRVWRRNADGTLTDIIPWQSGFRDDYGFVSDARGVLYWTKCSVPQDRCVVRRRLLSGSTDTAAGQATFARPLNFLAAAPDGSVLLADGPDLKRIALDGQLSVVARDLSSNRGRFGIMGMSAGAGGAIYLASFEDRSVIRLTPDGSRAVVARSTAPWQPSAVVVGPDGLWVTEYDAARVRLRFIGQRGTNRYWDPG